MTKPKYQSISPVAKLGSKVEVGPFTVIEDDVEIGENTWIGPHVTINNGVRIGSNCKIYAGAVLGSDPQDLKYEGEETFLRIGNNVTIREYCTINKGTRANNHTILEDGCLIMAYVHIAHDCIIGKEAIIANSTNFGGHVEIGKYAIISAMVAIHQFVKVGEYSMVGGGSLVRKSVPPYIKAAREPLSYVGVNSIGLRRRGFSNKRIHHIQDIYRILYVKGYNIQHALDRIEATIEATADREAILKFVQEADRGVMRGFRNLT